MVSLNPPVCNFGWKAPDFKLSGVDGKDWSLATAMGSKGLLVMFICNHCPYVKAIRPRLVVAVRELQVLGINAIAIQSNDVVNYPDDNFQRMQEVSAEFGFTFPYVLDETQQVARAYAHRISSASITSLNCNIAAASTNHARRLHLKACAVTCTKQ